MLLDDLVTAIQTVQGRIREHGASLSQNEYRTRLALIDPILNALGWDVSDPASVLAEYEVGKRRADYALLGDDGKPKALIEAKHLGEMANPARHEDQVFDYAFKQKVRFAGLTDGDRWIFEDVVAGFSGGQSRLLDVTISKELVHQCALKFLLLWHPTLASGEPNKAINPILVEPSKSDIPSKDSEAPSSESTTLDLISLTKFKAGNDKKPPDIKIPDIGDVQIQKWYDIFIQTAEWLVRTGALTTDSCPVPGVMQGYSIVTSDPQHENGTDIYYPHTLSNGLFLNRMGSGKTMIRNAQLLLKHCGQDPASILLKPSQ